MRLIVKCYFYESINRKTVCKNEKSEKISNLHFIYANSLNKRKNELLNVKKSHIIILNGGAYYVD